MKAGLKQANAISVAVLALSFGWSASAAPNDPLVMPSSWMPADWDQRVYLDADPKIDPTNLRNFRQNTLMVTPLPLWAVANYNSGWVEGSVNVFTWTAAIRSCDRGGQIVDDLSGEFGDRNRGQAALAQAQKDFKAWAATQPKDITVYFNAKLGQWNQNNGTFRLQETSMVTTLPPKQIERDGFIWHGGNVEFWHDQAGQAINHFQSSLAEPSCISRDGLTRYKFPRLSQWWIVFGDAYVGFGGITSYRSRAYLPPIAMSREAAAAFAQRNPQRKVEVAVTILPGGTSFNNGRNQYFVRAKYKQVVVTDALNGAALVSKTY